MPNKAVLQGNKQTQKPHRLDFIENQQSIPSSAQVHIVLCIRLENLDKLGHSLALQLLHKCTINLCISMLGSLGRKRKKLAIPAEALSG